MKQSSASGRQLHKNKLTITFDSSIKRISRRSSGWFFGSELMHFANAILLDNIPPARGAESGRLEAEWFTTPPEIHQVLRVFVSLSRKV